MPGLAATGEALKSALTKFVDTHSSNSMALTEEIEALKSLAADYSIKLDENEKLVQQQGETISELYQTIQ
jgi:hypothetical protein